MRLVQQVHAKIISILDSIFAIALAKVLANGGEYVESTIAFRELHTGNAVHHTDHIFLTTLEFLVHFLRRTEVAGESNDRSTLCDAVGAAGHLALQFLTSLHYIRM